MAKPKQFIKEETVRRLNALLKKHTAEELKRGALESDSLWKYLNAYEKLHIDNIIDMCDDGKTFDEIRFIVQGGHTMNTKKTSTKPDTKKKTAKSVDAEEEMDPVAQETIFMISQQRVVETDEPVTVILGDEDFMVTDEEQNEATDNVADDEPVDTAPVILSDITNTKKSKKKTKSEEKKDDDYDCCTGVGATVMRAFASVVDVIAGKYMPDEDDEEEEKSA